MSATRNRVKTALLSLMSGILFVSLGVAAKTTTEQAGSTQAATATQVWNFDTTAPGTLPAGWTVASTNGNGAVAQWQVIEDRSAPSGGQMLAMTDARQASGETFNVCWTDRA